ncbi:MAG: type IV secretory system conjugative DNA transfer family protein [Candidatus Eisenbacteria bacterium]
MIDMTVSLPGLLCYGISVACSAHGEYRRLKRLEFAAEGARIQQLRTFAFHFSCTRPDLLSHADIERILASDRERASTRIVERLLDLYDEYARDGVVIGTHSPPVAYGTKGWPYVAARHAARRHAPERTIGADRIPVILPDRVRNRHVYGIGKTSMGKTTLLRNLFLQDAARGMGIGVIGPESELFTEELLPLVPQGRLDDVIYVNPADTDRPVPLNPLHLDDGEDFDRKVDETLTVFHRLIAEDGSAAPRMEMILRFTLCTLISIPGTTLLDIPHLLDRTDDTYRRWAVGRIENEEVRHFWTSVYPLYPKDAHLSLLNRLGRFLQPKVVRNILCQPGAGLSVRAAMDSGKIVLFNLSDGILGELNAQLLGQLVVAKIQQAVMSRANIPKAERRPFSLYIDEFQSFCGGAGTSYEKMLSRARKYGLWLHLFHQQCGQIPEPVMREILGNVGTIVVFQVGATDARRLTRELEGAAPRFDHARLTSLPIGVAYCLVDGALVLTETCPPPHGGTDAIRDEAIRRSLEQFGVRPHAAGDQALGGLFPNVHLGDVF